MGRFIAGVAAALLFVTAGLLLWNGRAENRHLADAQPAAGPTMEGATQDGEPPAATDESREQRRFKRYDRDENGAVTREEYLAQRQKAFAKLDTNGDGKLSFDEYAAKAIGKFGGADKDKSGTLNPTEFATTATKRKSSATTPCPTAQREED
jgi:hypothetical protein